ncbi:MAG TPA: CHASE3 domain-containing protein, partial [Mycobacteriales bacterium]|nr:CHASE3 domain-containing protein [Mycobacteriales bacterium]
MLQARSLRQVVSRSYRGVTALVILLLAVVGTTFGTDYGYFTPEIHRTDQATRAFRQVHEGMVDQQTGVRGYLLVGSEDAASFLAPYVAGRAAAEANFAVAIRAVGDDREVGPLLTAAAERAARWQETWAEPAVQGRAVPAADHEAFHARGKTLFDAYRHAAETLIDALKHRKDDLVGRQQILFFLGFGLSGLAGAVVLAGVYRQHHRMVRALVDPIAELGATVHRIRDGDLRLTSAPARAGGRNRPTELDALATDVEDMARALRTRDAELHRSREMLVQAQHLTGVGSWELDVDTRALTWSDQMYVIKAVEPGTTVTPEMMLEMIHPDDRETMAQAVRLAATQGGVHRFDHRTIRGDGEVRYIGGHVEGELDADGRPFRVTGTSQDVTDRRAAEVALTESEARYR